MNVRFSERVIAGNRWMESNRIRVDRVGRHFSFYLAIMENTGTDAASIVVYNDTPTAIS